MSEVLRPLSPEGRQDRSQDASTRVRLARRIFRVGLFILAMGILLYGAGHRMSGVVGDLPYERYRDFYEFFEGARALAGGFDPYSAGHLGYIYPPLLAFLMAPLTRFDLHTAGWIWSVLHLAVLASALLLIAQEMQRRFDRPLSLEAVLGVALLALLVCWDKVRTEMNMQQSNALLLLSFALGLRWLDRRPVWAGIALAFGVNIKYLTLIALPYLLLRRRWTAAGSLVLGTAGWALLPAVSVGWSRNLEFLDKALRGLTNLSGSTADAAAKVMSPNFGWSLPSYAASALGGARHTPLTVAAVALVAAVFAGLCWLCYRRARMPLLLGRGGAIEAEPGWRGVVALEWAGLVVCALAFGPQTNSPHLSLLLLPAAAGVAVLGLPRGGQPGWLLVLGLAVLAAGLSLPPGGREFEAAVVQWRTVRGATWCILVMYLTLLLVGLPRVASQRNSALPRRKPPGEGKDAKLLSGPAIRSSA